MKTLKFYINEALKINSKSKVITKPEAEILLIDYLKLDKDLLYKNKTQEFALTIYTKINDFLNGITNFSDLKIVCSDDDVTCFDNSTLLSETFENFSSNKSDYKECRSLMFSEFNNLQSRYTCFNKISNEIYMLASTDFLYFVDETFKHTDGVKDIFIIKK
jgi:hypothetical protein